MPVFRLLNFGRSNIYFRELRDLGHFCVLGKQKTSGREIVYLTYLSLFEAIICSGKHLECLFMNIGENIAR
jgi:hypothetical protein